MNKVKRAFTVVAVVVGCGLLGTLISFSIDDYWNSNDCTITLIGPDLFQPGQLIELNASGSTAKNLTWTILPPTPNFIVIGNKRAIFTSNGEVKEYTIIVTGWLNGKSTQFIHTLSLGYDSNIAVTELQEKIISWLPADRTHDEVIKLAQSFNSIARIIENGTLSSPEEIVEATAWSTSDALGESIDKWKPFLRSLEDYLDTSPPDDHASTWREIARALEASDGAA